MVWERDNDLTGTQLRNYLLSHVNYHPLENVEKKHLARGKGWWSSSRNACIINCELMGSLAIIETQDMQGDVLVGHTSYYTCQKGITLCMYLLCVLFTFQKPSGWLSVSYSLMYCDVTKTISQPGRCHCLSYFKWLCIIIHCMVTCKDDGTD